MKSITVRFSDKEAELLKEMKDNYGLTTYAGTVMYLFHEALKMGDLKRKREELEKDVSALERAKEILKG